MKKSLLLSAALCATGFAATAATHNIYVANETSWECKDGVSLYTWGEVLLGEWPGQTSKGQVEFGGVKYDKFVIEGNDGVETHPIFNEVGTDNQIDLPVITLDKENYYFATNGTDVTVVENPSNPDIEFPEYDSYIYVLDKTGWDKLYLYGWADNQPQIFGDFPGAALTETEVIAGETYKKVAYPGNGSISYNLILNNGVGGDGGQFDGPSVPTGTTIYLEATATGYTVLPTPGATTYNIYVENKTDWTPLYLYAYYDGKPSLFGEWPGINVSEQDTETIDGVTYHVISNVEGTSDEQFFIFSDGKGGEGRQVDVEGTFAIDKNIYLTADNKGISSSISVVAAQESEAEYYTLQGVRVSAPENGIYICRKGSKVVKVVK